MSEEKRVKNLNCKIQMEQKIIWLKKIDEYELGSKNLKNVSTILNYTERFHILAFVVAGCI